MSRLRNGSFNFLVFVWLDIFFCLLYYNEKERAHVIYPVRNYYECWKIDSMVPRRSNWTKLWPFVFFQALVVQYRYNPGPILSTSVLVLKHVTISAQYQVSFITLNHAHGYRSAYPEKVIVHHSQNSINLSPGITTSIWYCYYFTSRFFK